jgi:hypothetical protein
MGPKHVVLIMKENVTEEINSCIIEGKLYVNKVKYSNATGSSYTRLKSYELCANCFYRAHSEFSACMNNCKI